MSAQPYSEMTYYSVVACRRLGDDSAAHRLLSGLAAFAVSMRSAPPTVDYFATSLPTMLLFTDDIEARRDTTALILDAQVAMLQGDPVRADQTLAEALARDPYRARALGLHREIAVDLDPQGAVW